MQGKDPADHMGDNACMLCIERMNEAGRCETRRKRVRDRILHTSTVSHTIYKVNRKEIILCDGDTVVKPRQWSE